MEYFKLYEGEREPMQITKQEAKDALDGWWKEDFLSDIFEQEKVFRLYTPYCKVWSVSEDGLMPMAGFYGVVE